MKINIILLYIKMREIKRLEKLQGEEKYINSSFKSS